MALTLASSPTRSPGRSLWADLSDEAEDDFLFLEASRPQEWPSNLAADSFGVASQDPWATGKGTAGADNLAEANRTYFGDSQKEPQPWVATSEALSCDATVMGPLSSTSSASASWSISASMRLDGEARERGSSSASSSEMTSDASPRRRPRLQNRKLSGKNVEQQDANDMVVEAPVLESMVPEAAAPVPTLVSTHPAPFLSKPKSGEGEWSIGAAKHDIGRCRRCLFYDSPVGCIKGADCDFCHLQHFRSTCTRPSKAKRDRYARLFQEIAEKRARYAANQAAYNSYGSYNNRSDYHNSTAHSSYSNYTNYGTSSR